MPPKNEAARFISIIFDVNTIQIFGNLQETHPFASYEK